jgi:hypothetical protein
MRDLGDKMLVSTSFLIDHIYKYHATGFSWHNLEQTPEIIAVNKAPELRKFISSLINFMLDSQLTEIINSLHRFKFKSVIRREISHLSKISELEGAAFNFTLDESLQLKKHYRRKLYDLIKKYRATSRPNPQFIYSISYLYMLIGDLHFFDKEYEDAVIAYHDAGQYLMGDTEVVPVERRSIPKLG